MNRPITFLMAAAALALSESAAAQLVPVEWDAVGQFSKDIQVPAGKFVEVCEKLPKGAKVSWSFDAAAALNFNIHYHEGKDVHYPAKKDQATKESGTLAAGLDQDYCWMWTNKASTPTVLELVLKRQ